MPLEITQIQPRIFYAKFEDCRKMCLAATRIDAKIELKDLNSYLKTNFVSGYSYNNKDISNFRSKFSPKNMSRAEKIFLKRIFESIKEVGLKPRSKFVFILCFQSKHSLTYKHEISHSLFYVNYSYRQKVMRVYKKIRPETRKNMMNHLLKNGYTFKNIDDINLADEVNARLTSENMVSKAFNEDALPTTRDINRLRKLYNEN